MTRLTLLLFIISVVLAGCVQVTQEYPTKQTQLALSSVRDMPTKFSAGSKFALSPKYIKEASVKADTMRNVYQDYSQEIINNLQTHQYLLAKEGEKIDFYVGFGLALSEDLSDDKINEKFGISPGLVADDKNVKGSFLIYVDDAKTGQRVWRGAAQGFVQENYSQEERKQRIIKVVDMLLTQYYNIK